MDTSSTQKIRKVYTQVLPPCRTPTQDESTARVREEMCYDRKRHAACHNVAASYWVVS